MGGEHRQRDFGKLKYRQGFREANSSGMGIKGINLVVYRTTGEDVYA